MKKKLFIIHPSDIIRSGLEANIPVDLFTDIIFLRDCSGLDAFCNQKHSYCLILSVLNSEQELDCILQLRKRNTVEVIQLLDNDAIALMHPILHHSFRMNQAGEELSKLVRKLVQKDQSDPPVAESRELTSREVDVLRLVALGYANKEIAEKLFISIHTVISHRKNITEKLGIKSIPGLTVYAILNRIVNPNQLNPEDLI